MVEGYTGRPGSGKTSTMVQRAFLAKQRGRKILANIPLVDTRKVARREYWFFGKVSINPADERTYGKPWSDGLVTSIEEIVQADNALILLDEVHMWLSSDRWKEISWEVRQFLAQQRKEGVDIWWTAQSAGRVFNVIRELTACSWNCVRYGPLTQLTGTDPETKEDMGKRWLFQKPGVWNLYNTTFKVGDGAGKEGTFGTNERYERLEAARLAKLGLGEAPGRVAPVRRLPAYATLERVETPDGRVHYVPSADLFRWWGARDRGEEVGASPLAGVPPQAPPASGPPPFTGYPEEAVAELLRHHLAKQGSHRDHERQQVGPHVEQASGSPPNASVAEGALEILRRYSQPSGTLAHGKS